MRKIRVKSKENQKVHNTQAQQKRRLILLELNELNFDLVSLYAESRPLPAFRKILQGARVRTSCEKDYELLEPWIQWPSVHTGLKANDHAVFRLGDIVSNKTPQIFETLEKQGLSVGCISPMNAENRLSQPAYFIPDPWTKTHSDRTWWSRVLTQAIAQVVNDNARSRIRPQSAVHLALALLRFAQMKNYDLYC